MTNPNDEDLDAVFAQARDVQTDPTAGLMARVLADATAVQAGFAPKVSAAPLGLWARMMDAVGGWPALSGLAAATVAGVWVGVAPPTSVEDWTAALVGDELSVSLFATETAFDMGVGLDG